MLVLVRASSVHGRSASAVLRSTRSCTPRSGHAAPSSAARNDVLSDVADSVTVVLHSHSRKHKQKKRNPCVAVDHTRRGRATAPYRACRRTPPHAPSLCRRRRQHPRQQRPAAAGVVQHDAAGVGACIRGVRRAIADRQLDSRAVRHAAEDVRRKAVPQHLRLPREAGVIDPRGVAGDVDADAVVRQTRRNDPVKQRGAAVELICVVQRASSDYVSADRGHGVGRLGQRRDARGTNGCSRGFRAKPTRTAEATAASMQQ